MSGGVRWFLASILALCACSDDSHPDTGYGVNQPVPSTRSCEDLCERLADCVVQLCNEDTDSDRYEGAQSILALQCEASCTDATVQSSLTASEWACTFTDSCRQVLEHDSCATDASYTCD
jgi:hypothetical protein